MATLEFIDDFLKNKFENPRLNMLNAENESYSMLLFQPIGEIYTTSVIRSVGSSEKRNYFVKNNDPQSYEKFKGFFKLAIDNKADLAVTPEYSCPWKAVIELIKNRKFPEYGKLWVIGCESIKPECLGNIIKYYRNEKHGYNDKITWICEEDKLKSKKSGQFLDAMCYIFKVKKLDGIEEHTIILVQFKTDPMGSIPHEIEHMLKGNIIYVIRNQESGINLFTLICSDSLNFRIEDIIKNKNINFEQLAYVIIHLQLNTSPRNSQFSKYRKDCYFKKSSNKNIICLNWARDTKICEETLKFGGSALYFKRSENPASKYRTLEENDLIMNDNHKKGLYYNFCEPYRGDIYFFNYSEHVFF